MKKCLLYFDNKSRRLSHYLLSRKDVDVVLLTFSEAHSNLANNNITNVIAHFDYDDKLSAQQNAETMKATLMDLGIKISHIFNPAEQKQKILAVYSQVLDVYSLTPEQIKLCTNKFMMKTKLRQIGLPVTDFYLVEDVETLRRHYINLNKHVVIKPLDLSTGIGVFELSPKTLEITLQQELQFPLLIERFIPFDEYTTCGLVYRGRLLTNFVTKNTCSLLAKNKSINGGITLVGDELKKFPVDTKSFLEKIVKNFNLKNTYLHVDFYANKNGDYYIGEVAARVGGINLAYNHAISYNFDIYKAIIDIYLDIEPEFELSEGLSVGELLLPPGKGKVIFVSPQEIFTMVPGVLNGEILTRVGDTIKPKAINNDRSGNVHIQGKNSQEVLARMQAILALYRISSDVTHNF